MPTFLYRNQNIKCQFNDFNVTIDILTKNFLTLDTCVMNTINL